ncbi:alpha/beta hydrolase [Paenibacillus sp. TRM 82003]|uniref:alpha/beta fold hydrolase n=1 Tax=Kineococcus sp. TRM81007 TaxID=2925831 RepID=UPI001F576FE1|nr:alpha/beta hydrolase [Kineococcus sp. TRM81007]MCI2239685.1 alpha/beta hydrolase [Kineococcus sp. TRM81007]MCI3926752.1 alpha/beta hydrolase [Paenibacillus sp. TRM 82003]
MNALLEGLAVREVGGAGADAPRVLLVHGLGGAASTWSLVAPALAHGFRLLLVDLPGHGDSPPPDPAEGPHAMRAAELGRRLRRAAARLSEADGRPVHLVGHSLGGWVCLEAAAADGARDPDERLGTGRPAPAVAGVVALAPAGLWAAPRRRPPLLPTGQRFARWYARAAPRLPFDPLPTRWGRTLAFAATSAAPRALPAALAREAVLSVASAAGYAAADAGLAAGSFTRGADVRAPVAVVAGRRDRVLPPAYLRREVAPPHARWLEWERCGHVPAWDRPADVVELVRRRVREAERAGAGAAGPRGPAGCAGA